MKKVKVILLIALVILLPFSKNAGQRMGDMSIVCAMGIDVEKGEYTVTLQYLNLYKGTGKSDGITGNITALAHGKADSIDKAIDNIQQTLPDVLFFGQNELIVIGAKTEKDVLLDYLKTSRYVRNDIMLARSQTTAREVVDNSLRGAVVPANSLVKQLKEGSRSVSVNDLLRDGTLKLPEVMPYSKYCTVL